MNRPGLLGMLALAVLAALGVLWWTDPSSRALAEIESRYQQEESRELAPAKPRMEPRDETSSNARTRTETEPAPLPADPPRGEPITRVTGVVVGGSEVFPIADRSGVTVYCWPGWSGLAPPKVHSLRDLKGLQTTTTDRDGRFSFDLFVDDAHWLIAVQDGASSNPLGMRIGTKPGVKLSLEMRRMVGSSYQLVDPLDPRPIDAVNRIKVRLIDVPKAKILDAESFPWAFFSGAQLAKDDSGQDWHGALFAWLPPMSAPPFTARLQAEIPGHLPVDTNFPTPVLSQHGALPIARIPVESSTAFGEVLIESRGIPEGLSLPFSSPLRWRLVSEEERQIVPIELRSPLDFPVRRIRVPVGSYRIDTYEHSRVRSDLTGGAVIEVRANETAKVVTDWSKLNFWVFQRDPGLEDLRFLTPPRIRVQNHQEPGFEDWTEPTQLVVLFPHSADTRIAITGDVFLEGPQGPRTEGRVTYYTAGIDDD